MVVTRLDSWLSEFGAPRRAEVQSPDVAGLLSDLEMRYPRLRHRIRDESGSLRRFVRIFVDGVDISSLGGLKTPLTPSAVVDILHSIAGG